MCRGVVSSAAAVEVNALERHPLASLKVCTGSLLLLVCVCLVPEKLQREQAAVIKKVCRRAVRCGFVTCCHPRETGVMIQAGAGCEEFVYSTGTSEVP